MKYNPGILIIFFTGILLFQNCNQHSDYSIFDTNVPDTLPEIFAKNIFNRDSSYIGYCSFDPKNKELYYAITDRQWNSSRILRLNARKQVDTMDFNINKNWEGEPMFTPDGQRMYFTAVVKDQGWHSDLFYVEKTDSGWSDPHKFELNSQTCEWHISFTGNNTAYFGSERDGSRLKADIYYSKPENDTYREAVKLPSTINTEYNDCDPLIAPDESYLIFHSDRPGGYGDHDLYIAFRLGDNTWSEPVNMGGDINTGGWEMGPSFSTDGRYLFYTRRKSWDTSEPSKIYWVDIAIIEKFK